MTPFGRRASLRIAELLAPAVPSILHRRTFENLDIIGPAILMPIGGTVVFDDCGWGGDLDALVWEIDPATRSRYVGAIGLVDVQFLSCRMFGCGIAATMEQMPDLFRGFTPRRASG